MQMVNITATLRIRILSVTTHYEKHCIQDELIKDVAGR
jgi:hypothetical protein